MRKLLDVVLLILTAGLFYLPPLCLFGVKENFVTLKGFEYPVKPESLSLDNYISKKYQSNFEKRFAMQFFMRKSFLKAKNQLYEWMNGGYFHSGYSGWIFTGRDGQLLERVYMTHYFGDFKFAETPDQVRNFIVIKQIADKLQAQGVDFVYVLAPDKVRMYPESLPAHLAVLEKRSGPIYAPYCAVAREKYRIPCFDAYSFLQPLKEKFELFPRRGTHWNALCAYLVADRIFRDLNVGKSAEARYPTPSMPKITRVSQSRYNDNDLQRLLNLIFDPEEYNVGTVPTFPRISPLPKEAIVLGDSFASQPAGVLKDMGCFRRVHKYQNSIPSRRVLVDILPRTKLFILVYTTPKLYRPYRYRDLKAVADSIPQWLPGTVLLIRGFYPPERRGVWGGSESVARIVLPPVRKSEHVVLDFDLAAAASMKYTDVYFQGKKVAVWRFPQNKHATLNLKVPPNQQTVALTFRNFDTCVPADSPLYKNSADKRSLGLSIVDLKLSVDRTVYSGMFRMAQYLPGTMILTQGFYYPEQVGVWGRGQCTAKIVLPAARKEEKVFLHLELGAFASMKHTDVYFQGKKVAVWRFPQDKQVALELKVPLDQNTIELKFHNTGTGAPASFSRKSSDHRELGIIIKEFVLFADRVPYRGIFQYRDILSAD